ncbi:MAG: hypothetical protein A3F84_13990 [Candidatus Handelsmanbacteria bacterium RIFCSPLOWO2_12_FULL_64_10]|uniref:ASPIC/UnbV domain-containing protein n=1 Tax=Handelsmanbacteria sp. (strain RIFCSPLOWO2_12_FULL_64_10) TaxID=1817868 RepID=A0A1F6CDT9_HANXR|nr:MAG: hypothetical protein A3F84_13990 [Candidatus Handelsmanbacteria bacterium RIFCSPLOWO2_12_FULL_64_10]
MNRLRLLLFLFFLTAVSAGASWAQTQPRFTDVTETAGVVNRLLGTSAAWGDYNGDGRLDLYVTNWGTGVSTPLNALFKNNGDGTFTNVAQEAGVAPLGANSVSATWVDYDNDGDLDLYVVDFYRANTLYRNVGNSGAGRSGESTAGWTFTNVTDAAGVAGGRLGNKTQAAWGDSDNDGDLDLYLCKYYVENEIYRNNGNGTFTEVDAGVGDRRDSEKAAWIDYDNDGDLDLYVVNREQANALYQNDGKGKFTEVAPLLGVDNTEVGRNVVWGDYDSDADLDCFLANIGANALYRNDGAGRFTNVSQAAGVRKVASGWISWAGIWGDFNHDGLLDLFVAHGAESANGEPDILFVGQASGAFADRTTGAGFGAPGYSTNAASADYDGDGDLDLFVVRDKYPEFETSRLFRNEQNDRNFIKVRVAGAGPPLSNRDGVGAKVRLLTAGTQTLRGYRVTTSGPQPASEAHFGVAPGTYDVEVAFPSGRTARQAGVAQGQTVTIQER